jgi:hypothetical protein
MPDPDEPPRVVLDLPTYSDFDVLFYAFLDHLSPDHIERMSPEFVAAWITSAAFVERSRSVKKALERGDIDRDPICIAFELKLPFYTYRTYVESLFGDPDTPDSAPEGTPH